MRTFQVIKKPLVTEKGTIAQQSANQYCFAVDPRSTKQDVSNAVENIFKVKVQGVRTMNVGGKMKRVGKSAGRTSAWKKAIVTLKEGDRIEFLEGA
ncbi:MAG: 50S ribosomal protein L23 [Pseudomonadota bacterium]